MQNEHEWTRHYYMEGVRLSREAQPQKQIIAAIRKAEWLAYRNGK